MTAFKEHRSMHFNQFVAFLRIVYQMRNCPPAQYLYSRSKVTSLMTNQMVPFHPDFYDVVSSGSEIVM